MWESAFLVYLVRAVISLWLDVLRFLGAGLRSRTALAAKNVFLRKQLALYRERQVKPRRASSATRLDYAIRRVTSNERLLEEHGISEREVDTRGRSRT